MRDRRIWLLALLVLLSLTAVGVASAQEGGDPERGEDLYLENCAVCHGEDGQGRVGATLQAFPGIDVDSALVQSIAEGVEGSVMPAWGEASGGPLTEGEIADIAAYIRGAFEGTDPIAPAPTYLPPDIEPLPDIEGDPSQGAVVYQANCVMCHGEEGRGYFGAPLAKSWPGVEPAVYINDVVQDGIPGTKMPPWAQEEGGPLTSEQIENVTAYVLSLAPDVQPAATEAPAPEGPFSVSATLVALGILLLLLLAGLVVYYRRA